jgi:Glycosyl hydrolase family 63 C-terminal domain
LVERPRIRQRGFARVSPGSLAPRSAPLQIAQLDRPFATADKLVLIARAMNGIGPGTRRTASTTTYFVCPMETPPGSKSARWWVSYRSVLRLSWRNGSVERVARLTAGLFELLRRMPELRESIHETGVGHFGVAERGIMGLVNQNRLRRILTRVLDENEFLSPYGIRSLSRYHAEHPYVFSVGGQEYRVSYLPAESDSGMFGGNSNWRGPIWMPVNALIIRALMHYFAYYGDNFKIECPTGSGNLMNLFGVAQENHQSPDPDLSARRERTAADVRRCRKISARS